MTLLFMKIIHDYARFIGASLDNQRFLHSFKNFASRHEQGEHA